MGGCWIEEESLGAEDTIEEARDPLALVNWRSLAAVLVPELADP
jgi:hypothetical protein